MRTVTSAVHTQLIGQVLSPCILCRAVFADGTLLMWSGIGNLTFNGNTYAGVGDFLNVSPVQETSEVKSLGVSVTLSGIPSSTLAEVLGQSRLGKYITIWLGLLTAAGALIADPVQLFYGEIDSPSIVESGDTASVTVQCESRLIDLERSRERRYTDQDQQQKYPGDESLRYVAALQNREVKWN